MFSVPRTLLFVAALIVVGAPRCCFQVLAAQANREALMQIPDKIPDNQLPLSPVDRKIDLLGAESNIHSPADSETYIRAILTKYRVDAPSVPGLAPLEHRLAVADYAAITNPEKRIPEARVVGAFNQLMDEWGTAQWTRISVEDFHRFHRMKAAILIPYSVSRDADGNVGDTCRPVESIYLLFLLSIERGLQSGPKPPPLPENFDRRPMMMKTSTASLGAPIGMTPDVNRLYAEYVNTRNAWLQSRFNINPPDELNRLLNILQIQ